MSQQLEKAENIFSEEINNHLTTNKNLIDAKKKLDEQERMISIKQTQILEQSEKLAAQAAQIDEQHYELSLHKKNCKIYFKK